eukprot:CAMPEP_0198261416 /NCGR_PEP_ID=MMETSP1447-20131203/10145_1 /TAXON_ID=420782 /ORGANISM="Chaetoceros dichaeta, Strain CCMP1751" /LENGTH=314 /DNA_ID=CAMNT_0043949325 /DNA_START=122 /DNA_END=1066 /DNA_ORIENTATION=+
MWARVSLILGVALALYGALIRPALFIPFRRPVISRSAVLVTGTSSGLGQHTSLYLASKGFSVFATVLTDQDARALIALWDEMQRPYREQASNNAQIIPIIMDVTSDDSVEAGLTKVKDYLVESTLSLSGIVNNAGIHAVGSIHGGSQMEDYQNSFNVNVIGVLRVTEAFLPLLSAGGRIVNIGSVVGTVAARGCAPYCATKHALEAVSDSWRQDLLPHKISVSLIQPGFTPSDICRSKIFCGDAGRLEEVSAVVYDALISKYPLTRYAIGKVWIIPSWLAVLTDSFLPDRLGDSLQNITERLSGGVSNRYWKSE